jgi:hypothetical protein
MKYKIILFFTIAFLFSCGQHKNDQLFQIIENNKIGYINSTGKVVIKPIFLSAGEFFEGLANARIGGTYGYIDETGDFVIQPQFDYATPFSEGLAIVYLNGQPFFIDKKGKKAFDCNYSVVEPFENGRALVKTSTNKMGFIDVHGKLIIDTAYTEIFPFINGLAVVHGLKHNPVPRNNVVKTIYEVGVIDTLGKFVVNYGKYTKINNFDNGYFGMSTLPEPWDTIDGSTSREGFMDKNGKQILLMDHFKNSWIDGGVHCGLVKMSLYKNWVAEENGDIYSSENNYDGFINLKGEIVINDTNYRDVEDFSDNRAFVQDEDRNYSIINTQGKVITKRKFDQIIQPGFKNGVAFVSDDWKWGLIDTNANFLIKPQFDGINEVGMIDDYFFFRQRNSDSPEGYFTGVANKNGSVMIKPIMQQFDKCGFKNGLLKCYVNNKLTYFNRKGNIVWQETEKNKIKQLTDLNIDFMNRGYFYAHSKPNEQDPGGHGGSKNGSKKITNSVHLNSESLILFVSPIIKNTIYSECNGITVFVANNSKKALNFKAQDSRLYMKVQALNKNNEWKDIEYLSNSWCGNSYHILTLEPKYFWSFVTPVYKGDFKTKLRIELKYIDPKDTTESNRLKKEITIYSNEFEGSINPGQFWRKQDYSPSSIMDPYFD